ncbi:MAG: PIN domain-containing protein, partial [Spirochaetales bacterium]|nr:PIN domain-containing protein [Spirochaetales bacterium]
MLYMLDTNIISYLLEGNEKIRKHLFSILSGNEIELPEIVYYEIERGLLLNNAKNKQTNFNEFCRLFP